MSNKTKKVLWILAIVICVGLIVYEGYRIFADQKEYAVADSEYDSIRTDVVVWPKSEDEAEEIDYPLLQIDFDKLSETNSDFVAWIYFPALDISYPVVHENTIDEYLHLTFEGKQNKAGCIFQDVLSDPEFRGMHDIVFGHNMRDGSMFGKLKKLYQSKENLLEKSQYVYVYTKDYVFQYRVFGYYLTKVGSDAYSVVNTDEEYDAFLQFIQTHSAYKRPEDADFSGRPSLLTLSTCSGSTGSGQRFVVHTYKTQAWVRE